MGITDLEEQFTFYASYHHAFVNQLIHIVCVWPILWTALVFTQYIPIEAPISTPVHPANIALFTALFYAAVYVVMDKKAGSLAALLVLICLITSRRFYLTAEISYGVPAWQLAVLIHVVCWIAQFVGHGVFEGRAPALLDNVTQAFVMAPFFVLLEVLFHLGYRKDMQVKLWKNVEKELARLKQKKIGKSRK
ncbi:hypothetical protein Ocin01_11427 [Orchesella cincta]|uniref:Endoplasmic reticulum membrane protein C16E8.02 n=1 Tax=Orchesella cincta TaxID=48709 RepID=A0A1D2MR13_ORCCI|nr:hypothetical protein Ocin01_11427 [Orchesella cincta]